MKPPQISLRPRTGPFTRTWALQALLGPLQALQGAIAAPTKTVALANEAGDTALVGIANEFAIDAGDGWALIPYGDFANTRGQLQCQQRFDRTAAEEMVGYYRNAWSRIKRAFTGLPIYRGHPDLADTVRTERKRAAKAGDQAKVAELDALVNEIERRYPDKAVYGTVADMEARERGLALKIVLTGDGSGLVNEEGLTGFSPHWLATDLPSERGVLVKRPRILLSLGLTARPNIPGTSLVNEGPDFPTMNKTLALQILAALGQPLANEATDEQINAGLQSALPKVQALTARPEPTALANEQTARTAAETKLAEAQTALANERTAHQATVKARNTALLDAAILAGRITEAQRPTWAARLDANFAAESAALANEQPALKTTPLTGNLGARKPVAEASGKFHALVNERMAAGEAYHTAWHAVKATKEGAALYEQMQAITG